LTVSEERDRKGKVEIKDRRIIGPPWGVEGLGAFGIFDPPSGVFHHGRLLRGKGGTRGGCYRVYV